MPSDQLQTLRVYELEPVQKHPTIFSYFDQLQPGESFRIENDHDPIPLYYQLKAERGDAFGAFEYLQKGPEIWVVQITKSGAKEITYNACSIQPRAVKEATGDACSVRRAEPHNEVNQDAQQYNACSVGKKDTAKKEGKVLDVTQLLPRLKHPTVFEWFNNLEEGESFTLQNDHDPKPLYYQMLGELGPVFHWQYTEQGPQWWKVVIQKKSNGDKTIGEIAAKDARKAEAMRKMGIDFCCGGGKTIRQAAEESGISAEELTRALTDAEQSVADIRNSFDKWDADFLADYIYNQHHKYFYEVRDGLLQLAGKVRQVHGQQHPELLKLFELLDRLFDELKMHFYKEEKVIFPHIRELAVSKRNGSQPLNRIAISQGPLAMMLTEHESAGEILKDMRKVSNDYLLPEDACGSYRQLYAQLQELESDLHQHIHLENNILFPKALQLEKAFVD